MGEVSGESLYMEAAMQDPEAPPSLGPDPSPLSVC